MCWKAYVDPLRARLNDGSSKSETGNEPEIRVEKETPIAALCVGGGRGFAALARVKKTSDCSLSLSLSFRLGKGRASTVSREGSAFACAGVVLFHEVHISLFTVALFYVVITVSLYVLSRHSPSSFKSGGRVVRWWV